MRGGRRTTWVGRAIVAVVSAGLLVWGVVASAGEWEKVSDKTGVLIERRAIPGTHLFEVRATVHSSLSPGAIFDTLWNHREYLLFIPHLKRLDLLSDTDDERLVYEQVAVPLARDRDYTVRLRKQVDAAAQRYGIRFATANDAGPPPDGSHVRVRKIEGSWSIELGADGKGSVLRYDVQTEPGGTIPTFVTNLAQQEAVAALVHAVLKRAQTIYGPEIRSGPTR
jgi:ribosome-associated toxin RatA of RatAB toxin-antitoxin module